MRENYVIRISIQVFNFTYIILAIQQNESFEEEVIQEEDDDSDSEEEFNQEEISKHIDNLLEEPIKEGVKTTPKHLSKRLRIFL